MMISCTKLAMTDTVFLRVRAKEKKYIVKTSETEIQTGNLWTPLKCGKLQLKSIAPRHENISDEKEKNI